MGDMLRNATFFGFFAIDKDSLLGNLDLCVHGVAVSYRTLHWSFGDRGFSAGHTRVSPPKSALTTSSTFDTLPPPTQPDASFRRAHIFAHEVLGRDRETDRFRSPEVENSILRAE
jgi:hypothetical protein